MKDNAKSSMFNASMLLAVAFVNGALITDSLIFFLIFIEALLFLCAYDTFVKRE